MTELQATTSALQPAELELDGVQISLQPLYQLCVKYYKENNGKNLLNIGYEDKNKLLAYMKQVSHGQYTPNDNAELGFLDVVGNDRRLAWQSLKDMDVVEAMTLYVKLLYRCSPSLKPYVIAYQVQQQEEERKRKQEEEERERKDREAAELAAAQNATQATNTAYEQQIRAALNQQTYAQFSQYASNLHPDDVQQQAVTVKQLQDQHYNQYLKQAYEQQIQQQQQQQGSQSHPTMATSSNSPSQCDPQQSDLSTRMNAVSIDSQHEAIINDAMANTIVPDNLTNGVTSANGSNVVIQEASMWTQKEINNFKSAIRKESKMENHNDCIIKVGSGETVTIRVPTHENGTCLFWEFATDHYDVAFGVHFEWTNSPDTSVQIQVSESSDEDEDGLESGASGDPEKANSTRETTSGPPIDEVVPIYRRDCHEEVYCGSHVYPGKGVYLLKFDNSYSLWRSKTLYYRVYYSR